MAKAYLNILHYLSTISSSSSSSFSSISSSKSFSSISSSNSYVSPRREIFTLWMKSLVYHGNGCTVYDSNGRIVYRIDNYNIKRSKQVHLMDSNGKVLFSIRNRNVPMFGHWDGYKWSYDGVTSKEIPWFQVKKIHNVRRGDNMNYYNVILGCNSEASCYNIILGTKSIKIVNKHGGLVAEVKQKQASSGVVFGDDVLTLVVEPHVDQSLVMALVTVCGLIHHTI